MQRMLINPSAAATATAGQGLRARDHHATAAASAASPKTNGTPWAVAGQAAPIRIKSRDARPPASDNGNTSSAATSPEKRQSSAPPAGHAHAPSSAPSARNIGAQNTWNKQCCSSTARPRACAATASASETRYPPASTTAHPQRRRQARASRRPNDATATAAGSASHGN